MAPIIFSNTDGSKGKLRGFNILPENVQSILFNRTNSDEVNIDSIAPLGLNVGDPTDPTVGFTWMTWIKTTDITNRNGIFAARSATGSRVQIILNVNQAFGSASRNIYAQVQSGGTDINRVTAISDQTGTDNDIFNGDWHHLAVRFNGEQGSFGTTLNVIVNGNLMSSTGELGDNLITGATFDQFLGARLGCRLQSDGTTSQDFFNGNLDEPKWFNKFMTVSEIQSEMMNLTVTTGSDIGFYYNFDEQSGTDILDLSPNEFHGTLVGGTRTTDIPFVLQS